MKEAYQQPVLISELTRGELQYPELWKVAQKATRKQVKFGSISAQCIVGMISEEYYRSDKDLVMRISEIKNDELKDLAWSGCSLIQVEEVMHHMSLAQGDASEVDLDFYTRASKQKYGCTPAGVIRLNSEVISGLHPRTRNLSLI